MHLKHTLLDSTWYTKLAILNSTRRLTGNQWSWRNIGVMCSRRNETITRNLAIANRTRSASYEIRTCSRPTFDAWRPVFESTNSWTLLYIQHCFDKFTRIVSDLSTILITQVSTRCVVWQLRKDCSLRVRREAAAVRSGCQRTHGCYFWHQDNTLSTWRVEQLIDVFVARDVHSCLSDVLRHLYAYQWRAPASVCLTRVVHLCILSAD